MDRIRAALKAKLPGTRGFTYYSTGAGPRGVVSMDAANRWIRRTWIEVEADGGRVVQAYITPEEN